MYFSCQFHKIQDIGYGYYINIITLRRCVKFNVQVASSVEFDSTAIAVTGIPHWP